MKRFLLYLFIIGILMIDISNSELIKTKQQMNNTKDWWETSVFYQIYPRSFKDTNGDGVGDLKGIKQQLKYLKASGIDATWLSPIFKSPMADFGYDISDFKSIDPIFGTMQDFDDLMTEAHFLGIKIILDFVPNHTSHECDWFINSIKRIPPYEDYYIWADGIEQDGEVKEPNNWVSVFYGSAWTFNKERGQYYLHQFDKSQPDLNYRNSLVEDEMKTVLRFWLEKGVAGFRVDAVNHLMEVEDLRDEPRNPASNDPLAYDYVFHHYTLDLKETYERIYDWRQVLDEWKETHGGDTRILMSEAYTNMTSTMLYYGSSERVGSHFPFNFLLIGNLKNESSAHDFVETINSWLDNMPEGKTANWVLGNHDRPRVGSRYGEERIDCLMTLVLTLPGVAITYYGEEIGMVDLRNISWLDTQDPQACNTNEEVYIDLSRDPVRTPFQWDNSNFSGFTDGQTPWLPVNPNKDKINLKQQQSEYRSHYHLYSALTNLRKTDILKYGDFNATVISDNVFVYTRSYNDEYFLVIINLGPHLEGVILDTVIEVPPSFIVRTSSVASRFVSGEKIREKIIMIDPYDALVLQSFANTNQIAYFLIIGIIIKHILLL